MARSSNGLFLALQVPVPATTKNANGAKRNRSGADYMSNAGVVSWPPASRSSSSSQFFCPCPSVSMAPRLGGSGLLSVFFLFCQFGLFGFSLSLPFGPILLAFLVAHMITPFRRSQFNIPRVQGPVIHALDTSFYSGAKAYPFTLLPSFFQLSSVWRPYQSPDS